MTLGITTPPRLDVLERIATSTISEADLLAGYQAGIREEPCACGGVVSAHDSPRAIAYAVELHNATLIHRTWRSWQEAMA